MIGLAGLEQWHGLYRARSVSKTFLQLTGVCNEEGQWPFFVNLLVSCHFKGDGGLFGLLSDTKCVSMRTHQSSLFYTVHYLATLLFHHSRSSAF